MIITKNKNLWDFFKVPNNIVVVTTNAHLNMNLELIMGAGIAKEAKQRCPELPKLMFEHARKKRYYYVPFPDLGLACLQTKILWPDPSPLDLVKESVEYFRVHVEDAPDINYHCPQFGCGNGGLSWPNQVLPLVENLPDNVIFYEYTKSSNC